LICAQTTVLAVSVVDVGLERADGHRFKPQQAFLLTFKWEV